MASNSGVSGPNQRHPFHPFRKPRRVEPIDDIDVELILDIADRFFDVQWHRERCERFRGRTVRRRWTRAGKRANRAAVWALYRNSEMSQVDIAEAIGVHPNAIYGVCQYARKTIDSDVEFREAASMCAMAIRSAEARDDRLDRSLRALLNFECGWTIDEIAADLRIRPGAVPDRINLALEMIETDREFCRHAKRMMELDRLPLAA